MKLSIQTEYMWDELSDKNRLKLILELVNTAPYAQEFCDKVIKRLVKENPKID